MRAQFARIVKDEPRIDQPLAEFLGRAYELKSLADYGTGAESGITLATAEAPVETATRFVDRIISLLEAPDRCAWANPPASATLRKRGRRRQSTTRTTGKPHRYRSSHTFSNRGQL